MNIPLEETAWAKHFKADAPISYKEALRLAADPSLRVEIHQTTETGDPLWAIAAVSHDPDFWMDALPEREDAEALCTEMGWRKL